MIKTAMILAAGRGERLRPYTDKVPKPLLPIDGVPMIVRLLMQLRSAGIERCVINTCYLAEQFIDVLGDGRAYGVDILWSHETIMLGAGGGIVHAAPLLGQAPFLLVSGDVVCDYDFKSLLQRGLHEHLLHAVMVLNPPYHHQGDWGIKEGKLMLTVKQKYTFGAIALINPCVLITPAYSMTELFQSAIASGQASGELYTGVYYNVGTVTEYEWLINGMV